MTTDLGLNDAQLAAVRHGDGPLLVLAGPGSGKTRVVTERVAELIRNGARPINILALTFTNKAATEMAERVARASNSPGVWVSTFHRFCSRLLRQYASMVGLNERFTIYDTEDSQSLLKSIVAESDVRVGRHTPRQIAQAISRAKNDLICPEDLAGSHRPVDVVAAEIYPLYYQRMLAANAVDFDDLLLHVVQLLHENAELRAELDQRFRYIIVDEYQDTNLAQYAIVRGLSIDQPNLTVTGDPDQSIYGWRGANIHNILRFEQDYPGAVVVRLEQNYRSTKNILEVADRLISQNKQRKAKTLWTENATGDAVRMVEYDSGQAEAEGIVDQIAEAIDASSLRPRDFAILYRTNALSRGLEHAFRSRGIPYQIVRGVEFYRRKEIKDILAYLQLIVNPQDEIAFLRVINAPPRGIGKVSLQRIKTFAQEHRLSLHEAAQDPAMLATVSKKIRQAIQEFCDLLKQLYQLSEGPVEFIVSGLLDKSGYKEHLEESQHEEDRQRLANIEELCTAAREYDTNQGDQGTLEGFLEQAALVNDTDDWADESDRVTLLTLHAAKGLEFPGVFIIATEDGILPHERSIQDPDQLEEERRLLFVGLTRAKQRLQVSYCRTRDYRGKSQRRVPSCFLMELHHPNIEFQRQESLTWPTQNEIADYARAEQNRRLEEQRERYQTTPETNAPARLMTAAEMLGDEMLGDEEAATAERPPADPAAMKIGCLVIHPVHGPGKVIEVSGSGKKTTVAVQFVESASQRKFRVAYSPLKTVAQ